MRSNWRWVGVLAALLCVEVANAQLPERVTDDPAVSGREQALMGEIKTEWKAYKPKTDNMGNVWVTFGNGSPRRLIVAAVDEPGYVVSSISEDGYLRVQRLPQQPPSPVFDTLHFAQPVWVITREGKKKDGVFAGLSVHLEPGRQNTPKMNHPDELYVDIGARSKAEVEAAGIRVLDSVALQRTSLFPGEVSWSGPGTNALYGREVVRKLPEAMNIAKAKGTTTIALATQQWIGGRGLNRLLTEIQADEVIFVGNFGGSSTKEGARPDDGVLIGAPKETQVPDSLFSEFVKIAEMGKIKFKPIAAVAPRITSYAKQATIPGRFVTLSVASLFSTTPAETISLTDISSMDLLLKTYLGIDTDAIITDENWPKTTRPNVIQALTTTYGASRHEGAVREKVKELLPEWARKRAVTDAAGNLVLRLGEKHSNDLPRIAFVAHMDEIGYEVKKIEEDGRLLVEVLGGGYTQYFLGHPMLVHLSDGRTAGAVLELPEGWDKAPEPGKPGFEWPQSFRTMDEPVHAYVGTKSREETEKLGIKVGDFLTIPKQYRALLGTRANARSFDDRVGCASLIAAVTALGPEFEAKHPGREVTFVWSTEEELGLNGAAAYAEQAAKENRVPEFVFAIDTFVSSDSPLEVKRFADAEIGKGFVVRAVDNSNIVPLEYVDRVVKMAKANQIPVQYGVTGGGNDGSVFTRYGSVDVALGWPLRYAHSPAEVIDTKDLDALGKIVAVIAREW